jgi:hypothetical protein
MLLASEAGGSISSPSGNSAASPTEPPLGVSQYRPTDDQRNNQGRPATQMLDRQLEQCPDFVQIPVDPQRDRARRRHQRHVQPGDTG